MTTVEGGGSLMKMAVDGNLMLTMVEVGESMILANFKDRDAAMLTTVEGGDSTTRMTVEDGDSTTRVSVEAHKNFFQTTKINSRKNFYVLSNPVTLSFNSRNCSDLYPFRINIS